MSATAVRILIIEDDDLLRDRIRRLLEDELPDASCEEASTAERALELVAASSFDIALLKVHLPGRNGIELVRELVAVRPSLAPIVLSGLPEDPYSQASLSAGAAAFVPRELAPEQLVSTIRRVMGSSK